ncbi:MAG: hypothetical protein EpisKO_15820 [Epibacterium sp.]
MSTAKLMASVSAASSAVCDLVEAVRDGGVSQSENITNGETTIALADALRLLLEAVPERSDQDDQLLGAVTRYVDPLSV